MLYNAARIVERYDPWLLDECLCHLSISISSNWEEGRAANNRPADTSPECTHGTPPYVIVSTELIGKLSNTFVKIPLLTFLGIHADVYQRYTQGWYESTIYYITQLNSSA